MRALEVGTRFIVSPKPKAPWPNEATGGPRNGNPTAGDGWGQEAGDALATWLPASGRIRGHARPARPALAALRWRSAGVARRGFFISGLWAWGRGEIRENWAGRLFDQVQSATEVPSVKRSLGSSGAARRGMAQAGLREPQAHCFCC